MTSPLALLDPICSAGSDGKVIPVDIAAAKALLAAIPVAHSEEVTLANSTGRILSQDVTAVLDLPPFDNSAMDGYAVSSTSFSGAGPWAFDIEGRIAAGGSGTLAHRKFAGAVRIFTGAPIPAAFDAVVMQEHAERNEVGQVIVRRKPRAGENVRRKGEDVSASSVLLQKGDTLTPQRVALLAAQGATHVNVWRKVRIGLISTGSELVEPGSPLEEGQIYNSNRLMIRAMLQPLAWAEIIDFGIVPDQREALVETISEAAQHSCDVLVTTGGVSAGEEDHVVSALEHHGGKLDVLKVAMRPGKPVKIGMVGGMLFAGLPGNPNAALVTFRQIALPAIRSVAGLKSTGPLWQAGVAGFSSAKRSGRSEYVPVRILDRDELGRPVLEMLGRGSSASLSAMALADGIALLPPDLDHIEAGTLLRFEAFCC